MAAVSALEPAPRTCGGDGSAPSLDAGEPAALPPAAGPTATGTALGSRRPYPGPRAAGREARSSSGAARSFCPGRLRSPRPSPTPLLGPVVTRPGGGRGWPEGLRGAWEPTWRFLLGFKIVRGRCAG